MCRRIRTKMILKRYSGKNLGKNSDSEKNAPSENQFVVFLRVTPNWTYLIWLTDLSLGNQHYHAAPIRKLRSWTNGFFKIVGFEGKRFLSSLPLPLLVIFCARPNFRAFNSVQEAKNASNMRKRLLRRLIIWLRVVSNFGNSDCAVGAIQKRTQIRDLQTKPGSLAFQGRVILRCKFSNLYNIIKITCVHP